MAVPVMADTHRLSDEEINALDGPQAIMKALALTPSEEARRWWAAIIAHAKVSARREGAEAMRERICAEYQKRIDYMKTNTGSGRPEFTIEFFEQRIIDIRALDPETDPT